MTEQEAIRYCEERAKICDECRKEHKQLEEWLKELLKYREIGTVLRRRFVGIKRVRIHQLPLLWTSYSMG